MQIHSPGILLTVSSNKTIARAYLGIHYKEVCETIPGMWVVVHLRDASSCLIDFELIGSHRAEQISTCRTTLLTPDPYNQRIGVSIISRLKQHIEHILTTLIINWVVTRVENVVLQIHLLWNRIVTRNVLF